MSKSRVEYHPERKHSPMTHASHAAEVQLKEQHPLFYVEIDGYEFQFASRAEIREVIAVFSDKVLPEVTEGHWLNRLPGPVKEWRARVIAVKYLKRALAEFEELYAAG